jgi:hypothetical protein
MIGIASKNCDPSIFTSALSPDKRYSAVFEDNGNVAYGYLLHENKIIGDVWLYNHGGAPLVRPWTNRSQRPPFENPQEFIVKSPFAIVKAPDEVTFVWLNSNDELPVTVEFWIRGELHARIAGDSKPGWCRMAIKDGPLALKL